jgi:hypothetical protein
MPRFVYMELVEKFGESALLLGQEEVGKLYNEAEKRYHESTEEDSHWVAS